MATKLKGTLKKSDLEGGLFVFEAEDGEKYTLENLPSALEKNDSKLEVEGSVQKNMASIAMTGPVFVVTGAKAI